MRKKRDIVSFRFKKMSLFSLFLFIVFGTVSIYAATSYRVNVSTTVGIDEFSQCRNCTNSGPADLFVPTNTAAEWTTAYGNAPTGVSYACCSKYYLACNGPDGWWYNGCGVAESLNDTCSGYVCNGGNQYQKTGCTGGSCTLALNETCSGYSCNGGNQYQKTGCSSNACTSTLNDTCSGYVCNGGDQYQKTGCSSNACTLSLNETCSGNVCYNDDVYAKSTCSGTACGALSKQEECTGGDWYSCDSLNIYRDYKNGCSSAACVWVNDSSLGYDCNFWCSGTPPYVGGSCSGTEGPILDGVCSCF